MVTLTLQETEPTTMGTFSTTDTTTDAEKGYIVNWKSVGTSLSAYYYTDNETFMAQSMDNMPMFGWGYTSNACQKGSVQKSSILKIGNVWHKTFL